MTSSGRVPSLWAMSAMYCADMANLETGCAATVALTCRDVKRALIGYYFTGKSRSSQAELIRRIAGRHACPHLRSATDSVSPGA